MALDYLDPATLAVPFYVGAIFVERGVLVRRRRNGDDRALGVDGPDAWASIRMGVVSVAWVFVINSVAFAFATVLWQHRLVDLGTGAVGWVAALIGWDFLYYWHHRTEHGVRLLWACHVSHHSSRYYNLTTAVRQPWTPFPAMVLYPLLALVGIRPAMIMISGGLNLVYQFWIHTEAVDRMARPVELVLNTPSHHRVHHGSNPQYLDRNHGGVLIVWDRLFGTFEPEIERVRYGLTKNIDSHHILTINGHEYAALWRDVRRAATWRVGIGHLLHGPGWTPAGPPTPTTAVVS